MKSLRDTETAKNLLRSFAGESQARNRYTFYSKIAEQEGFVQISKIFKETASNEEMHAKIFFDLLSKDFKNEDLIIDAGYPIAIGSTLENLKSSAHDEDQENTIVYPSFAKVALDEGFPNIATTFTQIAKIELHHKQRFETLANNVQNNTVFSKESQTSWICGVCGHIHVGKCAPVNCPVCSSPKDYFSVLSESY